MFYCIELKWTFDSRKLAATLEALDLTVIPTSQQFCTIF